MSKKIVAWIDPESAVVKYECDKPDNWDKMDGDERLEYFGANMKYANDYVIDKNENPDWYDGIDPDVDFEEE